MIQTLKLHGTDKQLYRLVGPLVMDPEILKSNNNYPFKTTDQFLWFIAINGKEVVGFIPVEKRGGNIIMYNYYFNRGGEEAFSRLLVDALAVFDEEKNVYAVVQIQHRMIFEIFGFKIVKSWNQYIKMRRSE